MPRYFIAILFALAVNIASANVLGNWVNALLSVEYQTGINFNSADTEVALLTDHYCGEDEGPGNGINKFIVDDVVANELFFAYSFTALSTDYPLTDAHYQPLSAAPPLHVRISTFLI